MLPAVDVLPADVSVVEPTSRCWLRPVRAFALTLATSALLAAPPSFALDGIDLSRSDRTDSGEEADGSGCSPLVRIKYPFLRCTDGEIGLADGDATWENSRRMPRQSAWIEGDGAWGPELNSD